MGAIEELNKLADYQMITQQLFTWYEDKKVVVLFPALENLGFPVRIYKDSEDYQRLLEFKPKMTFTLFEFE